jgi:hypothetical protein
MGGRSRHQLGWYADRLQGEVALNMLRRRRESTDLELGEALRALDKPDSGTGHGWPCDLTNVASQPGSVLDESAIDSPSARH